ncbi:MAG TPA: hypothetical protein VGY55_03995 [Pirellulales bacterium]|jgi:hypothetical protein|nr:hypothetical protein [Pirellulales bacterium]
MDNPANPPLNPPLLDGSESTPKARPVFRVLGIVAFMFLGVASFGRAVFSGFREDFWSAGWSAYSGFVFAAIGVSWYARFRHMRTKL